ncbi:hypothetical protein MMC06_000415 [Schaereria dolodes]|nr:hypothetical protein [Schaereria dolodes]
MSVSGNGALEFVAVESNHRQFLNSVLSTIGGEGVQQTPPIVRTSHTIANRNVNVSTSTTSSYPNIPSAHNGRSANNKRKAEGELLRPKDRIIKRDTATSKPINEICTANKPIMQSLPRKPSMISTTPCTPPIPYRGTGKLASATPSTTSAAGETKIPPKKGSYAEIMARAKAGQNATTPLGVIKHKPKDKQLSTKKELLMQKKGLKPAGRVLGLNSAPGSKGSSPGPRAQGTDRVEPGNKAPGTKAASTGYKGTVKPVVQPGYKGTMKPLPSSKKNLTPADNDRDQHQSRSTSVSVPKYRYREAYTDEDEEEEEEEDDYESDILDMEAGFSDVEEEDERALKAAKKEDEFEARMEAEMKRQKVERRRRLVEMAKKAQRR